MRRTPLKRTAGAPAPDSVSGAVGASVAKCLLQQAEPAFELLVARGQRWQEPDDVAVETAREQEQPLLERGRACRLGHVGRRLAQLEREHRAEPAYLADERLPRRDLVEPRTQQGADVLGSLREAGRTQLVEHGERGRAGDGITA